MVKNISKTSFKIGESYEDCKHCGEVTYTSIEYVANSKVECMSYVYDRECFDCGELAYPETGFFFRDELYCGDCCPEEYGE